MVLAVGVVVPPTTSAGFCIVGSMFSSFDSRLLSRLRRRVGRLSGELPGVLRGQSLPGAELHRITTSNAADGSSAEKEIQNLEANVPPGGAPRDEASIDVVPEGETRAAARGFEFPPDIV